MVQAVSGNGSPYGVGHGPLFSTPSLGPQKTLLKMAPGRNAGARCKPQRPCRAAARAVWLGCLGTLLARSSA